MLQRKKRNAIQSLIDLTPLLDVIFILLIVVLSYQSKYSAEADSRITEAERIEIEANDRISKTESENAAVLEQLDTYANLTDYVNVFTISADYQPSNRKYRTIYLTVNNEEIKIPLNPSNGDTAWKKCEDTITECLKNSPDLPAVYTVKNEKMLYRDEQAINKLFTKLSSSYDNIYLKNRMETVDE